MRLYILFQDVLEALKEKNGVAEEELKKTTEQRNQIKVKLVELKKKADARVAELNEQKREIELRLEQVELELTSVRNEKSKVAEDAEALRTELFEKQNAVHEMEAIMLEHENVVKSSGKNLTEKSAIIEELKSEIEDKQDKISVLESKVDKLQETIQNGEASNSASLADIKVELKSRIDQNSLLQEEKLCLEGKCSELEGFIVKLEQQIQSLQENHLSSEKISKTELELKTSELLQCQDAFAEAKSEVKQMRATIKLVEDKLLCESEQLAKIRQEKNEMTSEIRSLQDQLECSKSEICSLQDQLECSNSYLSKHEEVNVSLRESHLSEMGKMKEDYDVNISVIQEKVSSIRNSSTTQNIKF